jgi:hypothetical protein
VIGRFPTMRRLFGRMMLVLYRKRAARPLRLASTSRVRFRYRCGGRGVLWEFNRFLPEKPCQTGTLAKTILLIFAMERFWQPSASSCLRPHPFFKRTVPANAWVYARGSVRRASGFVLTG